MRRRSSSKGTLTEPERTYNDALSKHRADAVKE